MTGERNPWIFYGKLFAGWMVCSTSISLVFGVWMRQTGRARTNYDDPSAPTTPRQIQR